MKRFYDLAAIVAKGVADLVPRVLLWFEANIDTIITSTMNFDAFDIGDFYISTTTSTFFTPADGGRFRFNLDGRISWEIFNDFDIGLNVTESFDSRPPTQNAGRDFQYGLTIGWSWG